MDAFEKISAQQEKKEWYEQAKAKLAEEKNKGSFDRYAAAMKSAVYSALDHFCKQDEEFAQAVVQGGTFCDCMKEVAKNCGTSISDLEAFRRAVRFYFRGADVQFQMSIALCPDDLKQEPAQETTPEPEHMPERKIISLADFL